MFQFSCFRAFYQLFSFKPDNENNTNFDAVSSKCANLETQCSFITVCVSDICIMFDKTCHIL